jgi:hypothetical protein
MSSGPDSHRKERIIASSRAMFAILHALGMFVADLFKSRRHHIAACPRRTSPPLLQNLIFGTHSYRKMRRCTEQSNGAV